MSCGQAPRRSGRHSFSPPQTLGTCNGLTKAEITRARATTLMLGGIVLPCLWGPQWAEWIPLHDSGLLILRRLPSYPLALLSLSYSLSSLALADFWNACAGGAVLDIYYTGLDRYRPVSQQRWIQWIATCRIRHRRLPRKRSMFTLRQSNVLLPMLGSRVCVRLKVSREELPRLASAVVHEKFVAT
jgi:hypothetical protein